MRPMLGLTFDPASADASAASVTLVGGGPGDPELITVAGLKALFSADVVLVDHLGPVDLLSELPDHVDVIDVAKHPHGKTTPQERINELLIEHARAGKRVVRLKGGDGFVFGRGFEELVALNEAGISVRVIPGLTSPVSVPALAGIPVTNRGVVHEFTVVSGHVPPGHPTSLIEWDALARLRGTLVLLMAVKNAQAIAESLIAGGRAASTPVAVTTDGSLPTQRTVRTTLGELGEAIETHAIRPPAIIVIGEVAGLGV